MIRTFVDRPEVQPSAARKPQEVAYGNGAKQYAPIQSAPMVSRSMKLIQ